ncbi:MAG: GDSL-type esterase/lipase family protein [Synergistaceae bacterium]|jgi:lysophospholipase L1-like esterase|nr:GDSL-type esterase/lipase family protein [Synergistaceae bacterium]
MKKTVFVFGDSNSWGCTPNNDFVKPIERWDDDVRWPGVLQKELGGDGYKVLIDGLPGRTTVWDDPIQEYRCGKDQIIPSMDAAAPIDLIIIFVGTNDLKARYGLSAQDIANGAAVLVRRALAQVGAFRNGAPKVVLVGPPPLGPVSGGIFGMMFGGGEEKSKQLGACYKDVAEANGVIYFDAGAVVKSSLKDGLHLDADQHTLLGSAMADAVKKAIG